MRYKVWLELEMEDDDGNEFENVEQLKVGETDDEAEGLELLAQIEQDHAIMERMRSHFPETLGVLLAAIEPEGSK